MCIKFPSAFVQKLSQILMLRSKPLLSWPREILFFSFVHHFLTHSCLMFTEFSSACIAIANKSLSLLPRNAEHTFCDPRFSFFFFLTEWNKKIFFSFVLYSPTEEKRKDNYRYLWQWIIEIFVITQPNKLFIKRETIVEIVLSKKKT